MLLKIIHCTFKIYFNSVYAPLKLVGIVYVFIWNDEVAIWYILKYMN